MYKYNLFFRRFASVCVLLTQVGASTAFLILIAENLNSLLNKIFFINIGNCYLILIAGLLLLPLIMLKSPQDFWYIFLTKLI